MHGAWEATSARGPVSFAWRRVANRLRRRRTVILCYHGVGPSVAKHDPHFLRVPVARFRAQIELLLESGFEFCNIEQLVDRADGSEPPAGLVALTFDDGLEDNHAVVLPLLQTWGIPATVYVQTGAIGGPHPAMSADSGVRMMTEAQLRELASAGVEIGAHTVDHPDLSLLEESECLRQMVESRRTLERITGGPVRTFAYPFCRYGDAAVAAAQKAGFTAAVTCQGHGNWERYTMRRALITGKDGMPSFLLKVADAYQAPFERMPVRVLRTLTRRPRRGVRRLVQRLGR